MAYPQPNAGAYVAGGYQFFRLNTPLTSDGDIYQVAAGGLAFAIGPNSDVANVNIAYFDDQVTNFMNQIAISPQRPFAGRLDARVDPYTPSGRPGKILIWSEDLYNTAFRPNGYSGLTDRMDVFAPVLDVVQFFSNPGALPGARNDKTFSMQQIAWSGDTNYLLIPYYGRKYASFLFDNDTNQTVNVALHGVTFGHTASSGTTTSPNVETELLAPGDVLTGNSRRDIVRASVDGVFDMLLVTLVPAAAPNGASSLVRIMVSDTEV